MLFARKILLFFLAVTLYCTGKAQRTLQQIPNCPSNEIYDLLVDKKGFIWVAHNLGVSRFDGVSFTNFSNPEETSISMTNLIEDNYGRVWCHNFNSQIFYIQNDKMYYLEAYDFRNSFNYSTMVLLGDELIVATSRGFFICNTATMKCHYEEIGVRGVNLSRICIMHNMAVGLAKDSFFIYKKGAPVSVVKLDDSGRFDVRVTLEKASLGNSMFVADPRNRILYGLNFSTNKPAITFSLPVKGFFNTVTVFKQKVWVNTKNVSYTLDGFDSIPGYNITSMAEDKEGNEWFASLSKGLLVSFKPKGWRKIEPAGSARIKPNDYIKLVTQTRMGLLVASEQGDISLMQPQDTIFDKQLAKMPPAYGTIENVERANDSNYFVESSKRLDLLNIATGQLTLLFRESVKSAAIVNNTGYLGLSAGLLVKNTDELQIKPTASASLAIPDSLLAANGNSTGGYLYRSRIYRVRSVMFDTVTQSLLVSFSDGLQRIKGPATDYITYSSQRLYVSSMAHFGNKIYAATFNKGLFAINGTQVTQVKANDQYPLDAIVKIKRCNNHIWLFKAHNIEVLDATADTVINNLYPFPVEFSAINDAEEDSSNIYLATTSGMFMLPVSKSLEVKKADPLLLYTLVNNTDTVYKNGISLASNKNNILFRLAIPVYEDAGLLHFKYRLAGAAPAGGEWYFTQNGQRDIQFNALKPGDYTFQVVAVQNNEVISTAPLQYSFTITRPWFNTWWFYTTVLIIISLLFFGFYRYRLRQLMKIEKIRRKISADLHDDIGSTVSSINVYSQLAKREQGDNEYIGIIQSGTVDIINNLDDLVWNINPRNDVMGQLVNRMQLFAEPLLQDRGIQFIFKSSLSDKNMLISPNKKTNIYLVFKEAVNNVVKHSGSSVCSIYVIQRNNKLRVIVEDNGRGFDVSSIGRHRNGMNNMRQRANDLKGQIVIKSMPGQRTEIRLSCRV